MQDPACRAALDWLSNLALLSLDGSIAALALQLAAALPAAVAAEIRGAAAPGPELIALLQRQSQAELEALLDALEPVAEAMP